MSFDFTNINEEETLVDGSAGGGKFVTLPPLDGVALFRLRDIIEFGAVQGTYQGKPKANPDRPVELIFELVHPRHAIRKKEENDPAEGPFTGEVIRNHEVKVRLNKSFNEKAKYFKLFNKLNFDGRVATPNGKIPSFLPFLGKAFFGKINTSPKDEKDLTKGVWVNIDKDGEWNIGAPKVEVSDETGTPTGEYKDIPVAEMLGESRVFLWETGVDDKTYQAMWDSIAIVGEKSDGTPFKNFLQERVINGNDYPGQPAAPNLEWEGSRAQSLFGEGQAELDAAMAEPLTPEQIEANTEDTKKSEAAIRKEAEVIKAKADEPIDPLAELEL